MKTLTFPTELVVYRDEGHHFREPANVLDAVQREVGWFDRFLGSPRQATAR